MCGDRYITSSALPSKRAFKFSFTQKKKGKKKTQGVVRKRHGQPLKLKYGRITFHRWSQLIVFRKLKTGGKGDFMKGERVAKDLSWLPETALCSPGNPRTFLMISAGVCHTLGKPGKPIRKACLRSSGADPCYRNSETCRFLLYGNVSQREIYEEKL